MEARALQCINSLVISSDRHNSSIISVAHLTRRMSVSVRVGVTHTAARFPYCSNVSRPAIMILRHGPFAAPGPFPGARGAPTAVSISQPLIDPRGKTNDHIRLASAQSQDPKSLASIVQCQYLGCREWMGDCMYLCWPGGRWLLRKASWPARPRRPSASCS